MWYERQGRKTLETLIADLDSRGHHCLFLKEDGSICVRPMEGDEETVQDTLKDFPEKRLWERLVKVLEDARPGRRSPRGLHHNCVVRRERRDMKPGRTIQEIGAEILRQSQAKEDYLVNTNSIVMEDWDGKPMLHLRGENGMDLVKPLEIQQTAHRQIGDYLGIPRKYYDRMMDSDVGLLSYNVNRWLQGEPEQRMIRTMDGRARAFLSNRYRRIDNLDIARVTLPIIGEMPEARYESCQLTDDFLYIKVVNPRLTAEVTPGDVVQAGIIISNSETGQGSVCVQPLVYRLVCMNGMVVNDAKTRRTHLGRASNTEEDFMIYSQETLAADDKAIILKLQDTVRAAINEVQFAQVVDRCASPRGSS